MKDQANQEVKNEPLKNSLQSLIDSNPCAKCKINMLPTCKCGPGGGGGGGGSNGGKENADTSTSENTISSTSSVEIASAKEGSTQVASESSTTQSPVNKVVSFEKVAGLLSIQNNHDTGILTMKGNPLLSKEELEKLRDFLNYVKSEFEEFKKELGSKCVSVKNFIVNLKDNELAISIPNTKQYDAFIERLNSKNLLPSEIAEKRETQQLTNSPDVGNNSIKSASSASRNTEGKVGVGTTDIKEKQDPKKVEANKERDFPSPFKIKKRPEPR